MLDLIGVDMLQGAIIRKGQTQQQGIPAQEHSISKIPDCSLQSPEEHFNSHSLQNDSYSGDVELNQASQAFIEAFQDDQPFALADVIAVDHHWALNSNAEATNGQFVETPDPLAYGLDQFIDFEAVEGGHPKLYSMDIPSSLVDDL